MRSVRVPYNQPTGATQLNRDSQNNLKELG